MEFSLLVASNFGGDRPTSLRADPPSRPDSESTQRPSDALPFPPPCLTPFSPGRARGQESATESEVQSSLTRLRSQVAAAEAAEREADRSAGADMGVEKRRLEVRASGSLASKS